MLGKMQRKTLGWSSQNGHGRDTVQDDKKLKVEIRELLELSTTYSKTESISTTVKRTLAQADDNIEQVHKDNWTLNSLQRGLAS